MSEDPHRHPPKNMQDLLKMAIAAGGDNPVPDSENLSLDPERKAFLEAAIGSLSVDVVELMKQRIVLLRGVSTYKHGDNVDDYIGAMDDLAEYLDNIDLANDFYKLGGFDLCLAWILRGPAEMRWRAAEIIAVCSQNNPFCQRAAVETNRLRPLIHTASSDPDTTVRLKCFYAISCIVRENADGLVQFLSLSGHKLILSSLQSPDIRLQTKAAFLLSAIASKEPMFKDEFVNSGLIKELVQHIGETGGKEDVSVEHLLSALLAVVSDHNRAKECLVSCSNPLRLAIDRIISEHSRDPAYQEEVAYARDILRIINNKK